MVESLELSRLVLADEVPANAETWFIARAFADARERGVRGVVAFADPVPRHVGGRIVFPGHRGSLYLAANAAYLGRATPRTLTLLPDGTVLPARSAQKIRRDERGHRHVERHLVALGAQPRRAHEDGAAWLTDALNDIGATRLRHRGNHRFAFPIARTARLRSRIRIGLPGSSSNPSIDPLPAEQLDLFDTGAVA
jgi:hypothetical protein